MTTQPQWERAGRYLYDFLLTAACIGALVFLDAPTYFWSGMGILVWLNLKIQGAPYVQ